MVTAVLLFIEQFGIMIKEFQNTNIVHQHPRNSI